jgi:hypothetical protein
MTALKAKAASLWAHLKLKLPHPTWDKQASVQQWLTNGVAIAVAVIGATDPGFTWPSWTHQAIPIAAAVIAGIAHQIILRRATERAHKAGFALAVARGITDQSSH